MCVMLPSTYRAIYIDTEGSFRPERIQEIAEARGLDSKQILRKILFKKVLGCVQQELCIEAACSQINSDSKIKLLIIDSIINHYHVEYMGRSKSPKKMQQLNKYMHLLLKTARMNAVAIIITNHQTQSYLDGSFANRVVPLGGTAVSHASEYIIHLDGGKKDCRPARLEHSPFYVESDAFFAIDKTGFTDGTTLF